jgi:hypothetical protein
MNTLANLTPNSTDPRPLPVIIAERWNFPLQTQTVDGQDVYAVQDWLRGVMQKQDVRGDIALLKRNQLYILNIQLPYRATNGKTYQMGYTDAKGLYAITQRMDTTTGLRTIILNFLAAAGVRMDEYRLDPEKAANDALNSPQWADKGDAWREARAMGIISRKAFTDALRDVVAGVDGAFYAQSTEMVYKGLWERTTAQLRGDLQLTPKQNPRNHFGRYALIYTRLAEDLAADMLREHETISRQMACETIDAVARLIKAQADATRAHLGKDLVTAKRLIGGGR